MPGFLEDPLTGDFPSRNELEEEEEAALASDLPLQYIVKPTIDIADASRSPATLAVLIGPAASLLANAAFGAVSPAGSITVSELQRLRSPLEEELGRGQAHNHVFSLFSAENNTLIAASRRPLPPEQARTWAETVATAVGPAAIVVASSMLSMEYRGPGDPSEDALVFELHTAAAAAPAGVAALPPGTLLTGLPAALLEQGEAAGLPVTAIVAVESTPVPDAALVVALADAVSTVAGQPALDAAARAAVAAELDSIYRSSASNSMFI